MKNVIIKSLLVILSGFLTGIAFYHDYSSFLVWISLAPYLLVIYALHRRMSFYKYTFLYTFVFYLTHFYWLRVVSNWVGVIAYVGWLGVILYLSLIFLIASSLIYIFKSKPLYRIFGIPAVWVIIEWLNSKGMFGITSSSLAYTQKAEWFISQLAACGGIYLLTFLIILVNVLITELFMIIYFRRDNLKYFMKIVSIIAITFFIVFMFIAERGTLKEDSVTLLHARIIQPNIPQRMKMTFNYVGVIKTMLNNSILGAISDDIDLYVLPESLIPGLFKHHRVFYRQLAKQLPDNSQLVFGSNRKESGKYYNSLYVVDNKFSIKHRYDKVRLVPFGEYIPFRKIVDSLLPKKYALFNLDLFPGTKEDVSEITPKMKSGLSICFESVFSDIYFNQYQKGADYFIVITNDAWYLNTNGLRLHQNITAFRAVESGKPIIFCANTGISSYIDGKGKIVDSIGSNRQGYIDADIRIKKDPTFYYEKYNYVIGFCMIIIVILLTRIFVTRIN